MSIGALIFAYNNDDIDYVKMAAWSARNIATHLKIGTTVVTDNAEVAAKYEFEHVVVADREQGGVRHFADIGHNVPWFNRNRTDAYRLTPYDQTLVLDADYVVNCKDLSVILHADKDFMCHRESFDLSRGQLLDRLNVFGRHDFPMWWATVMLFRKSNMAQYIFDCMNMVRNNWSHYQNLYGFTNPNYRNDYALSIALGIVSGHTLSVDEIPWPLLTVLPEAKLSKLSVGNDIECYNIEYTDEEKRLKNLTFSNTDFHAMGKRHLGELIEADF